MVSVKPPRDSPRALGPRQRDRPVLRLLLVEDSAGDARLMRELITEGSARGIEMAHVETMEEAERHLELGAVDVVVLDLGLPDAQGLEAVRRAHSAAPRVPVVVVTGLDNEALAVEALKAGAEDFLVKGQIETRSLQRALLHAVERRALREALVEEEAESAIAARLFRTLVENLPDVISRLNADLRFLYMSPSVQAITGLRPEEFLGKTSRELGLSPDLQDAWEAALRRVLATGTSERLELAFPAVQGTVQFDCRLVPEFGDAAAPHSVLSVARDVTERWVALEAERRARGVAEELREATIELTRSLDREVVLVTLLDRLRQLVPFDHASVMLLEETPGSPSGRSSTATAWCPCRPRNGPEFEAADHPVVQSILETGAAVLIPDLAAHPDWKPADRAGARGQLDGRAAVRPRQRGRAGLAGEDAGRCLQRGAGPSRRGDVVAGLGRGGECGPLRADAGLDAADAGALPPSGRGAGERAPQHLPRAPRRGGPVADLAAHRPASAGARDRPGRGDHRPGRRAGEDDRRRDRRPAPSGRRSASGEPRSSGARRGPSPVLARGGRQVRPGGALQGAGLHRANGCPPPWRRRSTAWCRRR